MAFEKIIALAVLFLILGIIAAFFIILFLFMGKEMLNTHRRASERVRRRFDRRGW